MASSQEARAAIAWGQLPSACSLVLWVPLLLLIGNEMFTTEMAATEEDLVVAFVLMGIGLVQVVLGIWQIVLLTKCLAEVHQFSAWKGLGALILAGLLVFMIVIVPLIVLIVLMSASLG